MPSKACDGLVKLCGNLFAPLADGAVSTGPFSMNCEVASSSSLRQHMVPFKVWDRRERVSWMQPGMIHADPRVKPPNHDLS